jgi:tRNA (mo5U34)-methyltransferase
MNAALLNEMNSIKWWHRIELEPGLYSPGIVKHGDDGSNYEEYRFGIPHDLTGKTVLDIGAWDGYFSFACEKRNAKSVLAVDVPVDKGGNWGGTAGFNFAKKVLNSKVEFKETSVEELSALGTFDITLQFGVLYHLQNLLPALKSTFNATREFTLLETAVLPKKMDHHPKLPLAGFLHGHVNDPTNYWYPNLKCLEDMLKFVGYKDVQLVWAGDDRVTVKASVLPQMNREHRKPRRLFAFPKFIF